MSNRDRLWGTKNSLECFYNKFHVKHQELLDLLENADLISEDDSDKLKSILKDYEKDTYKLNKIFDNFGSHHSKIKNIFHEVRILKKKRMETLTRISSKMKTKKWDDDLPF